MKNGISSESYNWNNHTHNNNYNYDNCSYNINDNGSYGINYYCRNNICDNSPCGFDSNNGSNCDYQSHTSMSKNMEQRHSNHIIINLRAMEPAHTRDSDNTTEENHNEFTMLEHSIPIIPDNARCRLKAGFMNDCDSSFLVFQVQV